MTSHLKTKTRFAGCCAIGGELRLGCRSDNLQFSSEKFFPTKIFVKLRELIGATFRFSFS